MPQRSRLAMVAAKLESSYGTDSVPSVAANGQLMFSKVNPVAIAPKVFDVRALRPSFSPLARVVTPNSQKWDGEALLQGSGTAGAAPRLDAFLQACQMIASTAAGVSITYNPSSGFPLAGSPQSATIYTYLDGNVHQLPGSVGSLKMSGKPGEPIKVDFAMQGLYVSPTAQANPGGFATVKLKSSLNANYCYPNFVAFEFDEGLKIAQRGDASSSFGVKGFMPVERNARLKLTLEADFANRNFFPELEQGILLEAYFFQGAAAGNTVLLGFPSSQLIDIKYGDSNGIRTIELSFALVTTTSTADSEFFFKFT